MPLVNDLIFVHIPKCGGTTIEKQFNISTKNRPPNYDIYFGWELDPNSKYIHVRGRGYILQHLTGRELQQHLKERYVQEKTFTIVRNPLDRFISEVSWAMTWNKKALTDEYINDVLTLFTKEKDKNPHYRFMHEFVYDNQTKLVDNIFHIETDMKEVYEFIDKPYTDKKYNSKRHNITLNIDQIHSVYDTFYDDYNLFGYVDDRVLEYYLSQIEGSDIIVTFVDSKYLPIFNIFYDYFKKLGLSNLLVISLDDKAFIELRERNIRTILLEYDINTKQKFWEFRFDITRKIFELSKKNIIHTDADCFWFGNIMTYINNLDGYDIICQIAHGHPKKLARKYGFVMCNGFFKINYSQNTENIFNLINTYDRNQNVLDDQTKMNQYIFGNCDCIENVNDGVISKRITLKNNLKIGYIDEKICSRKYNKDLTLWHPFLPARNINNKIRQIYARKS